MIKIMFLGAADFQLAPIEYAKEKGYYVITCDNRPDNPGHLLADKSYNISTIDKDKVLEVALEEEIDGILTYGSDVSAAAVNHVRSKMGHSTFDVASLTKKNLFRKENSIDYFSSTDKSTALDLAKDFKKPFIVKPTDSAGSKGVSIVRFDHEIDFAIHYAFDNSIEKEIIVEEYVEKIGNQICGDGFMFEGELKFIYFGDGHFYYDRLAPWGETFPSTHSKEILRQASNQIESILKKYGYLNGPFNVDLFVTKDGIFVNEIGPRNGGNFIPQVTKFATGVDMIEATVEMSHNLDYKFEPKIDNQDYYYSSYMIHSKDEEGYFKGINYSDEIGKRIIKETLFVKTNDKVNMFKQGGDAIGNLMLYFDTEDEMNNFYLDIHKHIQIKLDDSIS